MAINQNKKNNKIKLIVLSAIVSIFFANFFIFIPMPSRAADDITQLNQKIDSKKKNIDTLQKEIDAFKENIKQKQGEARTLQNQIAILDNQIAKVNLDIEATQARIEETNLEIQSLNIEITDTQNQITDQKGKIAEYLRLIYQQDQVSYLEVMLLNKNFSDFFDQMKYTQEIHSNLKTALEKLKKNQQDLNAQKKNQQDKIKEEEKLKNELTQQRDELSEKTDAQQILLMQNKMTEKQYKSNLYQLQVEQQQINADIATLEKTIRKKLEEQAKLTKNKNVGSTNFDWPVNPARGITAYFHDPDYPFRYIYEHPAIDIRTGQGTPIKSPANGYIGRIKFAGNTSYAYIMVLHDNGLSTVFGHISAVNVKEDTFVTQGQIIAYSGGMPGSVGSGNLTTGPHLHFEVRLNGIPVNPLEYLPAL
ncbi:MAG: peptidoglycan DD-metalloendopeptidase family protein [Candidatus Buchananbacteria bacterium]